MKWDYQFLSGEFDSEGFRTLKDDWIRIMSNDIELVAGAIKRKLCEETPPVMIIKIERSEEPT